MPKYRKYDWPSLIKAFEDSDLTQTAFCQAHDLNPKYFNQRLRRFVQARHGLSRVEIAKPDSLTGDITIEYGRCRIHCSSGAAVGDAAQLVRLLCHD